MHGAAASGERGPMEAAGDNDDVNNHHRIASITTKVGRATINGSNGQAYSEGIKSLN